MAGRTFVMVAIATVVRVLLAVRVRVHMRVRVPVVAVCMGVMLVAVTRRMRAVSGAVKRQQQPEAAGDSR